jgi:flavodoxin
VKTLVVYDSLHGNTDKIARAIGGGIAGDVDVRRVSDVDPVQLESTDLLVVGSPTQGGNATPAIRSFIESAPSSIVKSAGVAVFDTRMPGRLVAIFGFAAGRMAGDLKKRGANLAAPPEGFIVVGREGPLKDGEEERARAWANGLSRGRE